MSARSRGWVVFNAWLVAAGLTSWSGCSGKAGAPADAGSSDAGAFATDSGADASVPDSGPFTVDAGAPDSGTADAGQVDAGPSDSGVPDAGPATCFPNDALYSASGVPSSISAGALSGHPVPDLAVTDDSPLGTFSLYLNDGGGGFALARTVDAGRLYPAAIAIGDLNHDGIADVVLTKDDPTTSNADFVLFLQQVDAGFGASILSSSAAFVDTLRLADLNRDGWLDVVGAENRASGDLVVFLQTDAGLSGPGAFTVGDVIDLQLADVNGDQNPDAVVAFNTGFGIGIALGGGDGTFQSPLQLATDQGSVDSVAVAPFTSSGREDIAAADAYGNLTLFVNGGDGGFSSLPAFHVGPDALVRATGADFDGDGRMDLALLGQGGNLYFLRGNGDGTFQAPIATALAAGGTDLTATDFDGDGRVDLAVAHGSYLPAISVLLNRCK